MHLVSLLPISIGSSFLFSTMTSVNRSWICRGIACFCRKHAYPSSFQTLADGSSSRSIFRKFGCLRVVLTVHMVPAPLPSLDVHPVASNRSRRGAHRFPFSSQWATPRIEKPAEKKLSRATSSRPTRRSTLRISRPRANIRRENREDGCLRVRFASCSKLTFDLTRTSRGCVSRISFLLLQSSISTLFSWNSLPDESLSHSSKNIREKGFRPAFFVLERKDRASFHSQKKSRNEEKRDEKTATSTSRRCLNAARSLQARPARHLHAKAASGPSGGAEKDPKGRLELVHLVGWWPEKSMGANQSGLDTNLGSRRSRRSFRGLGFTNGTAPAPLETNVSNRPPTRIVRPLRPLDTYKELRPTHEDDADGMEDETSLLSMTVKVRLQRIREGPSMACTKFTLPPNRLHEEKNYVKSERIDR